MDAQVSIRFDSTHFRFGLSQRIHFLFTLFVQDSLTTHLSFLVIFLSTDLSPPVLIPSHYNTMRGDEDETQIIFTVPQEKDKWVGRFEAKRMVMEIIREGLSRQMVNFEGQLSVVIPLTHTIQGMRYKLLFKGVPDSVLQDVVLPSLKDRGLVKLCTQEEVEQERIQREVSSSLKKRN